MKALLVDSVGESLKVDPKLRSDEHGEHQPLHHI